MIFAGCMASGLKPLVDLYCKFMQASRTAGLKPFENYQAANGDNETGEDAIEQPFLAYKAAL